VAAWLGLGWERTRLVETMVASGGQR